ncbi:MAG TPA: DUF1385 domain-containing protein [Actinomycetota bacterium]|nr:DUF1385 domain-containing protein [Actinomycetota bacterium]
MPSKPSIGGQAVMEGVMMRGPESWAVAVRKPDKEIVVHAFPLPEYAKNHPWTRKPLLRGVWTLVESLNLGFKALKISGTYAVEEEGDTPEDIAKVEKAMNASLGVGMVIVLALFVTIPAFLSKWGGERVGVDGDLSHNLIEGGIRIAFFLGYILLISLVPDIRRVFQYHGAEHKTIYAYENDDPMDPEVIDRYSTLHVRCGTNFLFIVMFVAIIGHFTADVVLAGAPLAVKLAARVLMIPVVAGLSYEVIRAAGRNDRSVIFRTVSLPGLALQKITTRPPTHDQIEVAIKAMEGVINRVPAAEPEKVTVYEVASPVDSVDHILQPDKGLPGVEPA